MRRRIVAGNWKLHGDHAFAHALLDALVAVPAPAGVERVVLPPLPYLGDLVARYAASDIAFGAQDVSANERGAYTGEVSAAMHSTATCARSVAANASSRSLRRAVSTSGTPRRAYSRAIAAPMPLDAPVTRAWPGPGIGGSLRKESHADGWARHGDSSGAGIDCAP